MLVDESVLGAVVKAAREGAILEAVNTFSRNCKQRQLCGKSEPLICCQCLTGTLTYVAVKYRDQYFESVRERLRAWCKEQDDVADDRTSGS